MSPWCGPPVSSHHVTRQGSSREFRPTLPARHSLSLSFPELTPDPRHSPPVSLRCPVAGPRPTGVTGHADSLIDVCPQAYSVKDEYQGAESALEPGGVRRGDHPVVGVEHRQLVSSLSSRLSLLFSLCHQPLYPGAWTSWRATASAQAPGGYYGKAFKGARGVTQGDPLSPTIFNVVADAVVRHWIEGL